MISAVTLAGFHLRTMVLSCAPWATVAVLPQVPSPHCPSPQTLGVNGDALESMIAHPLHHRMPVNASHVQLSGVVGILVTTLVVRSIVCHTPRSSTRRSGVEVDG